MRAHPPLVFEEVYAAHADVVLRLVWLLGVSAEDRDDVAQEVWAVAHRRLVDAERDKVRPWLAAITRHRVLYWRRSRRNHPDTAMRSDAQDAAELESPQTPESALEGRRRQEAARAFLFKAIPDETLREALLLHEGLGLTVEEVAELQGGSKGRAKWRIHQARRELTGAVAKMSDKEREQTRAAVVFGCVEEVLEALRTRMPQEEIDRVWEGVQRRIAMEGEPGAEDMDTPSEGLPSEGPPSEGPPLLTLTAPQTATPGLCPRVFSLLSARHRRARRSRAPSRRIRGRRARCRASAPAIAGQIRARHDGTDVALQAAASRSDVCPALYNEERSWSPPLSQGLPRSISVSPASSHRRGVTEAVMRAFGGTGVCCGPSDERSRDRAGQYRFVAPRRERRSDPDAVLGPSGAPPPSTARRAPAPGSVVADRYRIERVLREGGMGTLYRAHDLRLDIPVAVKFVRADLAGSEAGRSPLLRRDAKDAPGPRQPRAESALILIADDDASHRSIVRRALTQDGHEIMEAADGDEVLQVLAAASRAPDILLLDFCMPGFSGLGVLRILRRHGSAPVTFIMTGFPDRSVDRMAEQLGAAQVFHKPLDLYALGEAIRGALAAPG